jgi:hypothetical protein
MIAVVNFGELLIGHSLQKHIRHVEMLQILHDALLVSNKRRILQVINLRARPYQPLNVVVEFRDFSFDLYDAIAADSSVIFAWYRRVYNVAVGQVFVDTLV